MNTGVQDAYNLGWKLAAQTALDTQGHPDAHKRGEESFGLTITYRAPGATGPLVTGDRAPDAPVLDSSGKRIRLFDLFRGPHFTRLVFGAPAPDEEHAYEVIALPGGQSASGGRYVIDAEGHAFAAYAASAGDTVLIRPDGYLG